MPGKPSGDEPVKDQCLGIGRTLGAEIQVLGAERRPEPPQPAVAPEQAIRVQGTRLSYGRNLWMSAWHESAAYLPP